jgi:hypothetical protein
MSHRLLPLLATIALALWFVGVAGWLGTSPTVNWFLFAAGLALAAVGQLVSGRSSASAAARP